MVSKNIPLMHIFQLFDAKSGNTIGSNSKELRNMYKIWNPQLSSRHFDRQSKSHVLALQAPNKIIFPKDEKQQLQIALPYLIIQCFIGSGSHLTLDIDLKDATKTKRRIIFTNTVSKIEKKPFFIKLPNQQFKKQVWLNLCLDLASFMNLFQKCPAYHCLEGLSLGGNIKVRKIYFSRNQLEEGEGLDQSVDHLQQNLPKVYCFPSGIKYITEIVDQQRLESGQSSKKIQNVSLPKISNHRQRSTPKTVLLPPKRYQSSEQKKFMSNTNSTEIINRLIDKKIQKQSHSRTKVKNKKQQTPPLPTKRPNVMPWKYSERHESQDQRITKSEKITQLKKKNYAQKNVQDIKKGDISNYSDSDYFEMSQKFSTVTNPKFFKNFKQKQEQPEIQQFIEAEDGVTEQLKQEKVNCHMKTVVQQTERTQESILNQSQQGFLQEHLKNYIKQVQRPFSPPLMGTQTEEHISEKIEQPSDKIMSKDKELQLIYDPVLNCYYDFKTNTYYELKQ